MDLNVVIHGTPGIHVTENIHWENSTLLVEVPSVNGVLQSVHIDMNLAVDQDEKIFMNGYQTWTYSPEYTRRDRIRGMHCIPKKLIDQYAFDRYADYHFVDYPYKKGVVHGCSWCWFRKGEQYRLFASLNERNGYTLFQYNANEQKLQIEKDCKGIAVDGDVEAFHLFYCEGTQDEVFDAWFNAMHIKPRTSKKLYGYSSWYNRYQNIDATSMRKDLQGCEQIFEKNDLFQIDDGWEPFIGDWLEPDPRKFPDGMKEMADEIHAKGFRAGLWLAPFVAEEKSKLYQEHQDWFLKVDGSNWKDGSNWSGFYSLDIDRPEVNDYIMHVFDQVLNTWGYDLVKLDFLYGAAPFGNAYETRAGRMYRAMELLRKACGDKLILGCGVPVMPAFGIVDYCRIGCDVSLNEDDQWFMKMTHRERVSTRHSIMNDFTRGGLNNRAYLNDPDVFFLRDDNIQLNPEQKKQLAEIDALLGGVFLTSDDPSSYTDEMKKQYKELRYLAANASDIRFSMDRELIIHYVLDGKDHELKVDAYHHMVKA